jgi:hypothetical protein
LQHLVLFSKAVSQVEAIYRQPNVEAEKWPGVYTRKRKVYVKPSGVDFGNVFCLKKGEHAKHWLDVQFAQVPKFFPSSCHGD